MKFFKDLDSSKVFSYFYEISQIPRESKKERKISDYLRNFALTRNLKVIQDEYNNIIIKRLGINGMENAKTVILQSHMDMVCEKTKDSNHNFAYDSIEWVVEGDYLQAKDTTLGADDGIGIAYSLALLDDTTIPCPPLEVVITTDEESGMSGAKGIDTSLLDGKIFINIDTEEEGMFYLSCAGGSNTSLTVPVVFNEYNGTLVELNVLGLLGGHSGSDIVFERANASKIMARFLNTIALNNIHFNLVSIDGGTKHNVITRNNTANILINSNVYKEIESLLTNLNNSLREEYNIQDPNAHIKMVIKEKGKYQAMNLEDSLRVVYALNLLPYGPYFRSQHIDNLVQTSANIGVVHTDKRNVFIKLSIRSSIDSQRQAIVEQCESIGRLVGAVIETNSHYPAWSFNNKSRIKDIFVDEYQKLFNKKASVVAIHAGLECGLFKEKMTNDVDFISIGPNITGAHTVEERISISSVDRTWRLLKAVLKEIQNY